MTVRAVAVEPDSMLDRFVSVRAQTEQLARPLSPEDQVVQSMTEASPAKWHRGHTTWFYEEFILNGTGVDPFHPRYRYLFNSYYEAVGPRQPRPRRGMITRPSVDEVAEYRRVVDGRMLDVLGAAGPGSALPLVELGLNHEQQHQELLLMDIKHAFHQNPLRPAYAPDPTPAGGGRAPQVTFSSHPGGLLEFGHDGVGFAFDNEGPRHRAWLDPFAIADRLVSCGEWLEFMADGGYRRPEFWLSDGWGTVQARQWQAPMYWERVDGKWQVFTLSGLVPLAEDRPVSNISYYEADAYARWAGYRLPTEREWEAVAGPPDPTAGPTPRGGLEPRPATGEPLGQMFGELWQWTSSAYSPYPGFSPAAGAVGEYNGKFMVDQQVLRGSACITAPGHARSTYRNFFPAASQWAFSGLRLAADA